MFAYWGCGAWMPGPRRIIKPLVRGSQGIFKAMPQGGFLGGFERGEGILIHLERKVKVVGRNLRQKLVQSGGAGPGLDPAPRGGIDPPDLIGLLLPGQGVGVALGHSILEQVEGVNPAVAQDHIQIGFRGGMLAGQTQVLHLAKGGLGELIALLLKFLDLGLQAGGQHAFAGEIGFRARGARGPIADEVSGAHGGRLAGRAQFFGEEFVHIAEPFALLGQAQQIGRGGIGGAPVKAALELARVGELVFPPAGFAAAAPWRSR